MENEMTIHVNLFGGPCSAKSTISAQIFGKLKWDKIECERISEYAKDVVWEGNVEKLNNQIYIFAKQLKKHIDLNNKVKVLITDSPLPLGLIYDNNKTKYLGELILNEYNKFRNLNIFLNRKGEYNTTGRLQTLDEAIQKDKEIKQLLINKNIEFVDFDGIEENVDEIIKYIKRHLK